MYSLAYHEDWGYQWRNDRSSRLFCLVNNFLPFPNVIISDPRHQQIFLSILFTCLLHPWGCRIREKNNNIKTIIFNVSIVNSIKLAVIPYKKITLALFKHPKPFTKYVNVIGCLLLLKYFEHGWQFNLKYSQTFFFKTTDHTHLSKSSEWLWPNMLLKLIIC